MSTDAAIHETETATVVDAQTDVATACTEDPPAPESSHDVLPVTEPHSSSLSDDDTFAGPASAAGGLAIDDSSAETRISFLERNIAAYEEEIKLMRERQLASHVQVSTMWELLRRMHDMVLVFDLQGLIAFVSPACHALLGYRPDELFDKPLSSVLSPECHEEFEAHIQSTMVHQQTRELQPQELVTTHTFLRKDGTTIVLDGIGQAWQRGDVVEILFVYRDRTLTDAAAARHVSQQQQSMMAAPSATVPTAPMASSWPAAVQQRGPRSGMLFPPTQHAAMSSMSGAMGMGSQFAYQLDGGGMGSSMGSGSSGMYAPSASQSSVGMGGMGGGYGSFPQQQSLTPQYGDSTMMMRGAPPGTGIHSVRGGMQSRLQPGGSGSGSMAFMQQQQHLQMQFQQQQQLAQQLRMQQQQLQAQSQLLQAQAHQQQMYQHHQQQQQQQTTGAGSGSGTGMSQHATALAMAGVGSAGSSASGSAASAPSTSFGGAGGPTS